MKSTCASSVRLLVLGGYGVLGSALFTHNRGNIAMFRQGRRVNSDFPTDPTDEHEMCNLLRLVRPTHILNLNANADVDYCEKFPLQAHVGNILTVQTLLEAINLEHSNAKVIHISTDHLYDGRRPSSEHEVHIRNYYAFSKYIGESLLSNTAASVIRTNFIARGVSGGRETFTDWLYRSFLERRHIKCFEDVKFSPVSTKTLWRFIERLILTGHSGVMNFGSSSGMSKFAFSKLFFAHLGAREYATSYVSKSKSLWVGASRPKDMRMDVSKYETLFGVSAPALKDELLIACEDYRL